MLKKEIAYQIEWTTKMDNVEKNLYDMKEVIEYNYSTQKRKELAQKKDLLEF